MKDVTKLLGTCSATSWDVIETTINLLLIGFNEVEERPVRDQEKGKGTGKDSRAYQRSTYKPYSKEKTSSKDMSRPLKPAQRVVLNEMPPRGT